MDGWQGRDMLCIYKHVVRSALLWTNKMQEYLTIILQIMSDNLIIYSSFSIHVSFKTRFCMTQNSVKPTLKDLIYCSTICIYLTRTKIR